MSGDFKDGCMMLVQGQAALDAQVLKDAVAGLGTDEERINEILTQRNSDQIEAIQLGYVTRRI